MADDDQDTDEPEDEAPEEEEDEPPKEEKAPKEEKGESDGRRESLILKGIIAAALLGGLGYLGYLYQRTPAGDPCSQGWHCESPDGYGAAQCRNVVGRGNICVLGCKQGEPDSCPKDFACDQLVWDDGGVQTAWFCLPSKAIP